MDDVSNLGPELKASGSNIKELTETVKRQPWRLIWPSTKKYPEDEQQPAAETTPAKKPKPRPRAAATAPPRTR
jgi:hypothetical protein